MKYLSVLFFVLGLVGCGKEDPVSTQVAMQELEASCGLCHFGLTASECKLAVKVDGRAYFVEGVPPESHEVMHSPGGYCMVTRKAKAAGRLEDGKFIASSYELLPMEK